MSVKTKVITAHNDITLVEWMDKGLYLRAWVTPDMIVRIEGQSAIVDHPEAGIPYGERWSQLCNQDITPAMVENALRQSGIWTLEDLQAKPKELHGAVSTLAGAVVRDLLANVKARKLEESNRNGT